jgi:hypothetical protein
MYAYGSLYIFVSINDITSRGFHYKMQFGDLYASFADLVRASNGTGLQNILRDRLNLVIAPGLGDAAATGLRKSGTGIYT